jgi:DNA topoisomerase-3
MGEEESEESFLRSSSPSSAPSQRFTCLHVAEKPSLAKSIALLLCENNNNNGSLLKTKKSSIGGIDVHEFSRPFLQRKDCLHRFTSVAGHVCSIDFPDRFQDWEIDPKLLFDCKTEKRVTSGRVRGSLEREARTCDALVLWLDCDREGENICFEVMDAVVPRMRGSGENVFRAKFSAISKPSVENAMKNLAKPNKDESDAVDARQELDLKMGVAFTRFQTKYFQDKFSGFDSRCVSYGPCQTPTLGFCVKRHLEIIRFVPESFWRLKLNLPQSATAIKVKTPISTDVGIDGDDESATSYEISEWKWHRERVFDEPSAMSLEALCSDFLKKNNKKGKLVSTTRSKQSKRPPPGMNTVEMLKTCSKMGIGAHRAMQIAERLYLDGFISYPRTESSAYPPGFDFKSIVASQTGNDEWGDVAKKILNFPSIRKPSGGQDAGDHPPITPAGRFGNRNSMSGEMFRVYELVSRHFLATLLPDLVLENIESEIVIAESERWKAKGVKVLDFGWTEALPRRAPKLKIIPDAYQLSENESKNNTSRDVDVNSVTIDRGETQPPNYLTESELIGTMEKNGIGTDASIPTHINTVEARKYCEIVPRDGRRVIPTDLGITLCRAYASIDEELALPTVRAHIEKQLDLIAEGKADKNAVVSQALMQIKAKFVHFEKNIAIVDNLFEASFASPKELQSTPHTVCGRCRRYLKLQASGRRHGRKTYRLFCETEAETFECPRNASSIKPWSGRFCDICDFELSIYETSDGERAYPFCPFCYNHPPDFGTSSNKSGGCPHSVLHPIVSERAIAPCPECEKEAGKDPYYLANATLGATTSSTAATSSVVSLPQLLLDPILRKGGRWRLNCTKCDLIVGLPKGLKKVEVSDEHECSACDAKCLIMTKVCGERDETEEFEKIACCFCEDDIRDASTIQLASSLAANNASGGGRGGGRR